MTPTAPEAPPPPVMLSAAGAAARCGVTAKTWWRWLATGDLADITHQTPGGRRYWIADEVDAWLRNKWSSRPDSEATA